MTNILSIYYLPILHVFTVLILIISFKEVIKRNSFYVVIFLIPLKLVNKGSQT
jgi:hypothetical protein